MPDQMITNLKWWQSLPVNLLTLTYAGHRICASGAFDPDPGSGATTPSGFKELAAIYGSYRVTASRIRVQVINPDAEVPVTVTVNPTNLDPGSTPSSNYVIVSSQQPYSKTKMLALRGAPAVTISNRMTTSKIFGNKMTDYDDNFSSLTNANPPNMWFWFVGFYAPAVHTTSAVVANIYVEQEVTFFDRKILGNSPAAMPQTRF